MAKRKPRKAAKKTPENYQKTKEAARQYRRDLSAKGRDIGAIPPVEDFDRRTTAEQSFRAFCEVYFPERFFLDWSDDQLRVLGKVERAVKEAGLLAVAMPRGSGKTAISEVAVGYALLTGEHQFVYLVGSSEPRATDMLANIKRYLSTDSALTRDFPEVCYPLIALEGETRRCLGQTHHGTRTDVEWGKNRVRLPLIQGSAAAGSVVWTSGLSGAIRGAMVTRHDGAVVRPSFVVVDDPQTDESARSLTQTDQRERVLMGAVLNLAGPGKAMSGVMPCTVIQPGDLSDRVLNHDLHPEWQGERTKAMYKAPTNTKLWAKYEQIWKQSQIDYGDIRKATEFYLAHREAMDAGAEVAWPARFEAERGEVSAIQFCMNLKIQDPRVFQAEYQNDPIPEDPQSRLEQLDADAIAARVNGHKRGVVPAWAHHLTAFIDVHKHVLFWVVCGWSDRFQGAVVDYGVYPKQPGEFFDVARIKNQLARQYKGHGFEAMLYQGLTDLAGDPKAGGILSRGWDQDGGGVMRVGQCLVDASWGESTEIVYRWCRESQWAGILHPWHGRKISAAMRPFSEYRNAPGDRTGLNWRIPAPARRGEVRHVLGDISYWKTFVATRLSLPVGDPGSLTLFGREPREHRHFAEHCTAQFRVETAGRGRVVDDWKLRPQRTEDHWWDCLVGASVAASILGANPGGMDLAPGRKRKRNKAISLSEIQKRRKRNG